MKKPWIFLFALAFAGAAHAQYKWIDKDGKTRYGDTPPAGVKATKMGAPASGEAPSAVPSSATAAKDAKKGPLTPAEQEQEYRRRQEATKKEQEKSAKASQAEAEKVDNCNRAREYQRTLELGQRVMRTDAKGERYYMDDAQMAQELVKVKQTVQQVCAN
jgi:hypothetical protein